MPKGTRERHDSGEECGETMNSILEKVERYIADNDMLSYGEHVVAGVSGGADSMCLLFVLMALRERLGLKLCVVHINHGIRGEAADKDQEFVEKFCENHGILWKSFRADIPALAKAEHLSEEEAGRQYRYRCFEEALQEMCGCGSAGAPGTGEAAACGAVVGGQGTGDGAACGVMPAVPVPGGRIAVAHNKNDVTETVLMNLFRGCGLRGLCGIPPVRGNIIRPLLCLERSEIEQLLSENGQSYRTDSTNFENDYTRNRLRNEVIPYLKENINAGAPEHVYQLTQMASGLYQYISRQQAAVYPLVCREDGSLDVQQLSLQDPVIIDELLRRKVEETVGKLKDISQVHINQIAGLLHKPVGKQIQLPYGLTVTRGYTNLKFAVTAGRGGSSVAKPAVTAVQGICGSSVGAKPTAAPGACGGSAPDAPALPLPIPPRGAPPASVLIPGTSRTVEISLKFNELNQRIEEKQYTKWFDYAKIKNGLKMRHRQSGDYLVVDSRGSRKLLRRLMIDEKVPRDQRDDVWLVADGDHVVWIIGGRISDAYKVTGQTKEIIEIKVKGEE